MPRYDRCLGCMEEMMFHVFDDEVACPDCGEEYRVEEREEMGYRLIPVDEDRCVTKIRLDRLREFAETR